MRMRMQLVAGLVALILLGSANPALAISSIRNSLTVNSAGRYVSSGEKTTWLARTSYGQWLVKNPYTSDFECLVNARHFSRPRTYQRRGASSYWGYVSYSSRVSGPAWRSYTGTFWVWQPRTAYARFYTYAKRSGYRRGWVRHRLGQHSRTVSYGSPSITYTYHY